MQSEQIENGEVVAKKANLMPGYIVLLVLAVLLAVIGIAASGSEPGALAFCLVLAGIFAVLAIVCIIFYVKKPKELIVYADGKLYLPNNVVCEPLEITHVLLKLTRTRYGVVSSTGGMVLTINGTKIKINSIANVKDAEQRLSDICNRAAQQAAMAAAEQEHGFAPAGAETVPTAAPAETAVTTEAPAEAAVTAETPAETTADVPASTPKDDDPFGL